MLDIIKQAAIKAMEDAGPVNILEATILTPPPALSIQLGLDTKNPIPAEMLIVDESLMPYKRKVEFEGDFEFGGTTQTGTFSGEVNFTNELQAGDKVTVLSVQGGQSFYILGRGIRYGSNA